MDERVAVDVLPGFDYAGGAGGGVYHLVQRAGGAITDGGSTFSNLSSSYTVTLVDKGTADGTHTIRVEPLPSGTVLLLR
jgi:hypothetical protein